jgi:AraC-like DNA-binding protein
MYLWRCLFETPKPFSSLPCVLSVCGERRTDPGYHLRGRYRQAETHCIFKYTLSGEGAFLDADGEHRVPAGSGFLCEIYDPATEYYYPPDAVEPWEFVYINFIGETGKRITRELVRRYGPIYSPSMDSPIIKRLAGMRGVAERPSELYPGEGAALVFELLCELEISKNARALPDPGSELVARAKDVMEESLPKGIPIGELALSLEVSREHLSRVFLRETGTNLRDYMARRRLIHACRLLKETSMELKSVGEAIGIDAQQHFARFFKRGAKMTPSQFRRSGMIPEF